MRYGFELYIGGGGEVFRYAGGVSVEGLVGRLDLGVESKGVSKTNEDFNGEFSAEVTRFGCEVVGFWLSIVENISNRMILTSTFYCVFHCSLRNSC